MMSTSARIISLVETATGEIYTARKHRSAAATFGRRFTVIFDETTAKLAASLDGTAARLFLLLPAHLDFRSWKRLRQTDLAEALGLDQSVISRALRQLERHHVVEARGKGPTLEWRLSRSVGYRGRPEQYHAEERDGFSRSQEPQQAALRLGPLGVVKGRRKPSCHVAETRPSV